jgi:hypothetical protein
MGNLYIRAIETKEDMVKVINDEFTPGLIAYSGFNKRVKFEMKKMRKIGRKCNPSDIIEVKFCNKVIHCKINDIEIDEITGSVSWIELENISKASHTKKKIPLVFKNTESLSLIEKELKVYLTEVDISGKNEDIPEFISVDLKDVKQKEFKISNLKIDTGLKVMNKKDDIIALIKSKPYYYVS